MSGKKYDWQDVDWLTQTDVAEILEVHPSTISRMIKYKKLRAIKVGRQYRIAPDDLDRYIKASATVHYEDEE